jgi:hypothetical protein
MIEPFLPPFSQAAAEDLRLRLRQTRWPGTVTEVGEGLGVEPLPADVILTKIGNCEYCDTPSDKMDRPLPGMSFCRRKTHRQVPHASANITPDPSGISYYDEAMFIRTMRTGKVGARLLNPPMPWWVFRNMSDDDLKAIFAYLAQ